MPTATAAALPVTAVAVGLVGSVEAFGEDEDASGEGAGGVGIGDGSTDGATEAEGASDAGGAEATGMGSREGDPDRMASSATTTRMATRPVATTRIQPLSRVVDRRVCGSEDGRPSRSPID
jgi:hypothetical protein